jgi:multiple sugar transport system permease protein
MTSQLSTHAPAVTAAASSKPRRRRLRPGRERSNILTIALLACTLYFLLPLVWLAISSTKSTSDLFATFGFWFSSQNSFFSNIHDVFTYQDGEFVGWIGNTVLYAGTSAVGAAALATAAGYAFGKYQFPGGKAIFSGILGAIMIPATALAIPTYLLFATAGIVNTPLAVILPSLVNPFGVYLMRVYSADAIPDSLVEAARIDGAGEFRIFWTVGVRLMGPGIVTVFLFALVATWNNYFLPLIMLSQSQLYPLTVGIAQLQSQASSSGASAFLFSTVITGSFISVVPLIIAFLYLQRYWQTGLTSGSLKG